MNCQVPLGLSFAEMAALL
ncbi:hypothetical protein HU200_036911 [Digitaria exilis]|uniref:Uncharacterized protein n=1 Tax=Digitaria exilis TaxID=1010633 RepID=A0A835BMD5_9POAL|nr:hypothetical protein HU200_036911 [Digitaria exilis]